MLIIYLKTIKKYELNIIFILKGDVKYFGDKTLISQYVSPFFPEEIYVLVKWEDE